jgi:hypothetical protein
MFIGQLPCKRNDVYFKTRIKTLTFVYSAKPTSNLLEIGHNFA